MPFSPELTDCLHDLEERIDEGVEAGLRGEWERFVGDGGDRVFMPRRPGPNLPRVEWPKMTVNEALADFDRMALQQYGQCSQNLARGDGALLCVRANYGTAILPDVFGAGLFMQSDTLNTLPAARPLVGGTEAIRRIVERGPLAPEGGCPEGMSPEGESPQGEIAEKVFEMGRRFAAIGQTWPKIGRWVNVYHPDLQGPFDVAEMLWGGGLFLALYEEPALVHDLLAVITETYRAYLRAWEAILPPAEDGLATHWGLLFRGRIMLRDDSAMNLSPALIEEFVMTYDQRLLTACGGGAIHACGRVDHYVELLAGLRGLTAFNFSQPELNDMDWVMRQTVDRGIRLLALPRAGAEQALGGRRELRGGVHAV